MRTLLFRSPIATGLGVFILSFGAILAIRIVIEGNLYLTRWWSFRLGDSVFLPLYGFFVAIVLRDKTVQGFQGRIMWVLVLLGVGFVVSVVFEIISIQSGRDPKITWLPSQVYHTAVVLPALLTFVVWSALVIITQHRHPLWATIACAICLLGWVGTFVYDSVANQSPSETIIDGRRV